jgi:phosphotransferase system enzyme I (PtsP)
MLSELRDIVREVRSASSLDEVLAIVVRRIEAFVAVDACAVYLTDVETDQHVRMASRGLHPASDDRVRTDRLAGLIGLVNERRELIVVTNATTHPRSHVSRGTPEGAFDTFLGVPLIHYHRILGVLAGWKRSPAQFDEKEVTFFVTIAAQLARLIHEAAAVEKVTRIADHKAGGNTYVQGVPAAPGVAIGTATLVGQSRVPDPASTVGVASPDVEERRFGAAMTAARQRLRASTERLAKDAPSEMRELFDAYSMLLASDRLVADTVERIRSGSSAAAAWRHVIADRAKHFDQMANPYLRARGEDVRSVGDDVLFHLEAPEKQPDTYPERCILVGDTVGVMEISAVPAGRLAGIVCVHGSALSHTAVLARALGIPAVVAISALPIGPIQGRTIVLDGDDGRIYLRPSAATLRTVERRIAEAAALSTRLDALRDLPAVTSDGVRVPLYANIGLELDAENARRNGAEGVGLYRTEYLFLLRESFPLEDEQYGVYRRLLEGFAPNVVTVRTLDVGGDKILPYFPVEEKNPFLGCRGIRFSLEHPEIFLIQLRALLRANAGLENLQVLFPMISRVAEVDEALDLLARAHTELSEEGTPAAKAKVGAMIEVPSAVFLAKALAERVDYLSVGTNDLAQYLLAADRNNAQVATPYDSVHPAVLDAVAKVVRDAHGRSTPVTVCGELAGDPAGALALLGMGVDVLSMRPASLSRVKLVIRTFTARRARVLLESALALQDGLGVHRLLNAALEEAGV